VAVFGGVLFVRPGARVVGPIVNLGGEVYPSGLAQVGEVVEAEPELRVGVEFDTAGARVSVALPDRGPSFRPFGPRLPTYDRVNGLTVAAGPSLLFTGDPDGPRTDAWVSYRTARGSFGGGVSGSTPLGRWRLDGRVERGTLTSERWFRGDLANTLGSLTFANDFRDYWESDRAAVTLSRPHPEAIIAGEYAFEPRLTLMAMRDRSLRNRDPWALFGDFDRENPFIDETEWASATVGAGFRWQGSTTAFAGDAGVEQAIPAFGDEADFTQWTVDGLWTMQALYLHQIGVRFRAMGTLGDEPALRQRRTFLGGVPTLPTFGVASFRGDRLAFVESTYGVPLPQRLALPIVGPPSLRFTHAAGMAWLTGTPMPEWEQNLGAGIAFSFASAEIFIDPAGGLEPKLVLGLELPAF